MKQQRKIWVVDDEESMRTIYEEMLRPSHDVQSFESTDECLGALESDHMPDLIVADVSLREGSLVGFLQSRMSQKFRRVPFIVVSGHAEPETRQDCYRLGALDYIIKPFPEIEFIAKINRVLALADTKSQKPCCLPISMNPTSMTVHNGEIESQTLTSKEYQIVSALVAAKDCAISRNDLVEAVWTGTSIGPKTLDVHIYNLRRKLIGIDLDIRFQEPRHFLLTAATATGRIRKSSAPCRHKDETKDQQCIEALRLTDHRRPS